MSDVPRNQYRGTSQRGSRRTTTKKAALLWLVIIVAIGMITALASAGPSQTVIAKETAATIDGLPPTDGASGATEASLAASAPMPPRPGAAANRLTESANNSTDPATSDEVVEPTETTGEIEEIEPAELVEEIEKIEPAELVEDYPDGVELPQGDARNATIPDDQLPDLSYLSAPDSDPGPQRLPENEPVAPEPVALDIAGEEPELLPDRAPPPPVSLSAVAEGGADNLSGNSFGCSSRCITTALLSANVHDADLAFEMVSNVETKKAIWVLPGGPPVVNGIPVHLNNAPRAVNQNFGTTWNVDIGQLTYDTTYRIVVTAVDTQGNLELATDLVTTAPEPVQELVANGSPCQYTCIDSGVITPGVTPDRASISVEATAPVSFVVAVSRSQPEIIGGEPVLQSDVAIFDVDTTETTFDAEIAQLKASSTYFVLVRVTDVEGNTNFATGSFITAEAPVIPLPEEEPVVDTVVMWIPRFHIRQDGDAVGSGEIQLRYGFREIYPTLEKPAYSQYFVEEYQKLDAPVNVIGGGFRIVHVGDGEYLPPVQVQAIEHDRRDGNGCENEIEVDPLSPERRLCGHAATNARLAPQTLGWVRTLPTCDSFDVPGVPPNDRCYVLKSGNRSPDHVAFDTLIAFRIV